MKKSICMLGCAMIGVLAACSSDSAFKPADPALVAAAEAAVITPTEAPSPQIVQRFANELRILDETGMMRETIKDADGSRRIEYIAYTVGGYMWQLDYLLDENRQVKEIYQKYLP